jgi:C-methyltransferase
MTVEELAERTGTHPPSLYRLLRALAGIGVFVEADGRRFASNELGALLQTGRMRAGCLMMHSRWHDRAWGELLHSVQTGESGFERAHGEPLFSWLESRPDEARIFNDAMTAGKAYRDRGVAEAFDFVDAGTVVDVGGGHGSLLISILTRYPHLHGTLVDLPGALDGARAAIQQAGLTARCEVRVGDFFEQLPTGADVYLLAHILHDWDDEHCRRILDACGRSMRPDSKLLLIESPMSESDGPDRLEWLDLEMLVLTSGGRERTATEYGQLLQSAGFRMLGITPTSGSRSVIQAERVAALGQ